MSQHSEELRTKVREALAARMHRANKELLGQFAVSRHAIVLFADDLSVGVAAAIEGSWEAAARECDGEGPGPEAAFFAALRGT